MTVHEFAHNAGCLARCPKVGACQALVRRGIVNLMQASRIEGTEDIDRYGSLAEVMSIEAPVGESADELRLKGQQQIETGRTLGSEVLRACSEGAPLVEHDENGAVTRVECQSAAAFLVDFEGEDI